MNHLTNLYKHKCEQLQEQLNHLTRMLNEVTAPAPAAPAAPATPWPPAGSADNFGDDVTGAAARAAAAAARARARAAAAAAAERARRIIQETRERLHQFFRELDPEGWWTEYQQLNAYERAIFHQMYGRPNSANHFQIFTRTYLGSVRRVMIQVGADGIPRIMYWDPITANWIPFPNGYPVPGIGSNGVVGIKYTREWQRGIAREGGPGWEDPGEFTFNPEPRRPPTDPDGNINTNHNNNPGGIGDGGGGGGINPNNQSGLGVQY